LGELLRFIQFSCGTAGVANADAKELITITQNVQGAATRLAIQNASLPSGSRAESPSLNARPTLRRKMIGNDYGVVVRGRNRVTSVGAAGR